MKAHASENITNEQCSYENSHKNTQNIKIRNVQKYFLVEKSMF